MKYSKKKCWSRSLVILVLFFLSIPATSQHSVARKWNDALLDGIRNDFARPTVHARNLFHVSAAMYDTWAVFNNANTYLLGNELNGFVSNFNGYKPINSDIELLKEKAISYAAFRLLNHRFAHSPNNSETLTELNNLFLDLGYDPGFTSSDYSTGSAAALGNYIAETYIAYGLADGANEALRYVNQSYEPVNDFLVPSLPGNPNISDPNRWQPLAFDIFIDQSGNVIPGATPEFLGPEWGSVWPFSLKETDKTTINRDGFSYQVYHDPGPPPYLDPLTGSGLSDEYKWGFALVAVWSSHLNATLEPSIDISPAAIGNMDILNLPESISDYDQFYDLLNGGDISQGRTLNPKTGLPYPPQIVPLGDYGRVLAEFWADGPDSETPPGHWFTLLNYVSDHPEFSKKFNGQGAVISDLEWDIKAYFILGGTMHDVAISAWGIKGYYDYIRPISAIRYMTDKGQSTDDMLPNYNVAGIPLIDGKIELVLANDPLVGSMNEHLNKIKIKSWRGPDFINDPATDVAGVDWILAENWWPYQRPTFVTPPFAGYISGHSTYSRAAAEVLTLLTGDEYFPGGVGEFLAPMNEFLVFEDGPSQDITLQWATYRDASDQCSLSRIWGGIHPPADDLPGRKIGEKIGQEAYEFASKIFQETVTHVRPNKMEVLLYPNPVKENLQIDLPQNAEPIQLSIINIDGKVILTKLYEPTASISLDTSELSSGLYLLTLGRKNLKTSFRIIVE